MNFDDLFLPVTPIYTTLTKIKFPLDEYVNIPVFQQALWIMWITLWISPFFAVS